MNGRSLSRRATVAIATAGVVSLLGGFVAAIFFEPAPRVRSAQADAFSRSAVGHRAFVELLRRLDRRVLVARSRSAERAQRSGVLLLLEPPADAERLRAMLEGVGTALVVLPKRTGVASDAEPGFVARAGLADPAVPGGVLDALGLGGTVVVRPPRPFVPSRGTSAGLPALERPQLVVSTDLEPVVASDDGILVGATHDGPCDELWVVSDADLIANHGLGDGENAAVVAAVIGWLCRDVDVLVVDETLHGHEVAPHVFGVLGRFPLVLALAHGAALVGVLVWIASRRLGAPLPEPPALQPGRRTLVESTAELLLHGGHSRSALRKYLRIEERRVAAARGLPRGLDAAGRRAALARLEARRRPTTSLETLVDAVGREDADEAGSAARLLWTAGQIHRWRREMLHGTH